MFDMIICCLQAASGEYVHYSLLRKFGFCSLDFSGLFLPLFVGRGEVQVLSPYRATSVGSTLKGYRKSNHAFFYVYAKFELERKILYQRNQHSGDEHGCGFAMSWTGKHAHSFFFCLIILSQADGSHEPIMT